MENENGTQDSRAEKLAGSVRTAGLAAGSWRMVKAVVFSVILILLAVFTLFIGVPWYVAACICFVAAAIPVIELISLKRVAAVNLQQLHKAPADHTGLEPGEELAAAIPAVMQYGKVRSTAVLRTGRVIRPENALLVTTKAIWAVTVPLPGVDKVVSGTDIGQWQWMTAWQDIARELQEMLDSLPLNEVLRRSCGKRLMALEAVKEVKRGPFQQNLTLESKDGKKYSYSIRVKEDFRRAMEILKPR